MESKGGRKSTVTVLYSYTYCSHKEIVSIKEGERLILSEKSNVDWWKVRRPGESRHFYAPATYLHEDGTKNKKSSSQTFSSEQSHQYNIGTSSRANPNLLESKSDDCLLSPDKRTSKNAKENSKLSKQRSTSMDAIMFLELLENEIKDMPTSDCVNKSTKYEDKFKKPRISKDLWERRKSWAVEELAPQLKLVPKLHQFPALQEESRKEITISTKTKADHGSNAAPKYVTPPPRPPRPSQPVVGEEEVGDTHTDKVTDKAPALPPKKNKSATHTVIVPVADPIPIPRENVREKRENYSKVTPLRIVTPNVTAAAAVAETKTATTSETSKPKLGHGIRQLSESLEKLALQIQPPKPPKPSSPNNPVDVHSLIPPQLPPKKVSATKLEIANNSVVDPVGSVRSLKSAPLDNYVNLLRPLTMIDATDEFQSDESGINMSFSNPMFCHKEDLRDKGSQEQLSSSQDLESSMEDCTSLKAIKIRGSLSGSEMEGNASSSDDLLSSKDSLNSIPSTPTQGDCFKALKGPGRKLPPESPTPGQSPQRELFEGWGEYTDSSGRPFYYNVDTKAKSWKPPRRSGPSPRIQTSFIEEEVQEDASSSFGTDNKKTLGTASARPAPSQSINRPLLPVPPGWIDSVDPYTEEVFYINSLNGERWYTSADSEGRLYFYEENSNESLWALPSISSPEVGENTETPEKAVIQQGVFYPEGSKLCPKMNAPQITVSSGNKWDQVRHKTLKELTKAERNTKARSMVLTNFSGNVEDIPLENSEIAAKTASLPRNTPQWPNLHGGSIVSDYLTNLDIRVLQQGVLHKTKLTENGKKLRKNWTSSWVVLTDLFVFIFKDSASKHAASSISSTSTTNKLELCVDLNGAVIEWAAVKSSRKGVFQVSTLLGVQLLLHDEDETNAVVWFDQIRRAISRLPCSRKDTMNQYPALPSPTNSVQTKWGDASRIENSNLLAPPMPEGVVAVAQDWKSASKSKTLLGRTKSTKVRILGSTEDLTAVTGNPVERQIKLRDKLRKLFVRRPALETLVRKGIWKDEPVFGRNLQSLCMTDESTIPKFVERVIEIIESKPDNMKTDGIYRASGNLSQVQKIRCQVDQNNWVVLDQEEDIHVLTGCLKLFFRELKEPLIPFPLFERALRVTSVPTNSERIRLYKELMETLPPQHYDTLQFLLRHLLKITEYREYNRMHISNLAIVFGPTIMWAATDSMNLALDMMQQNLVAEALLINYQQIFT